MKYVLRYRSTNFDPAAARAVFPAHQAHYQGFFEAGTLLLLGPITEPPGAAMAVFTSRDAAESFAAADPFVLRGVVSDWAIEEWREVLQPPP